MGGATDYRPPQWLFGLGRRDDPELRVLSFSSGELTLSDGCLNDLIFEEVGAELFVWDRNRRSLEGCRGIRDLGKATFLWVFSSSSCGFPSSVALRVLEEVVMGLKEGGSLSASISGRAGLPEGGAWFVSGFWSSWWEEWSTCDWKRKQKNKTGFRSSAAAVETETDTDVALIRI